MQPLSTILQQEKLRLLDLAVKPEPTPVTDPDRDRQRCAWLENRIEMWSRICPPIYLETDSSRLAPPAAQVLALHLPKNAVGVLLSGPTGTGKSRTAWLLARKTFLSREVTFRAYAGSAFGLAVASSFAEGSHSAKQFAEDLAKIGLLLLDDLFKGRMTPAQEDALFATIEARTAWKRPTIITMNADGSAVRSALSADVADPFLRRLRDFFKPFLFTQKPKEA